MYQFFTIKKARVLINGWQEKYNKIRPHSGLSGSLPAEFTKRYELAEA